MYLPTHSLGKKNSDGHDCGAVDHSVNSRHLVHTLERLLRRADCVQAALREGLRGVVRRHVRLRALARCRELPSRLEAEQAPGQPVLVLI